MGAPLLTAVVRSGVLVCIATLFSCRTRRKRGRQQGSVRITVSSSNRIGRSDAFEPLQQSHGLRVIGETMQRNGEIVGAEIFCDVSNFQIVLAGPHWSTGD